MRLRDTRYLLELANCLTDIWKSPNYKAVSRVWWGKPEEYSRRKQQWRHVIFDGKNLVREYVITKKGEGCVISGILGGLRTERSQWNPKNSNSFLFISHFLSFSHL